MTKYEEIAAVSREWIKRQDEAKLVLEGVVMQFIQFCEIPGECLRFLPWDETRKVFIANPNELRPLSHSVSLDNRTDEWGVGVSISLAPPQTRPQAKVAFSVHVKVDGPDYTVRFGSLKPQSADLGSPVWCNEFFQSAVESLKGSFKTSSADTEHGFHVSLSQ